MIKLIGSDYKYPIKFSTFPGGEEFVRLDMSKGLTSKHYEIVAHIESSKDIMCLLLVTDAIRRSFRSKLDEDCVIDLQMPYFPYARQDRVMVEGESFSVKVMADLINLQRYHNVTIWDAHSDVTPALINNLKHVTQETLAYIMIKDWGFNEDNCVLVAPDAGAIKKVTKLAQRTGIEMVRADKLRNVKTGEIQETIVYSEHVGEKNFVIIDDICDGGRTFTELAEKLRPLTNRDVILYVTHGIFSKGLEVFEGKIDGIYCPNVFSLVDTYGYTGVLDLGKDFNSIINNWEDKKK